jgi:hypothetical protein
MKTGCDQFFRYSSALLARKANNLVGIFAELEGRKELKDWQRI